MTDYQENTSAAACYGYENKQIARVIGNMSVAAVSKIRGRVREKLERSKSLKMDFERLKGAMSSV